MAIRPNRVKQKLAAGDIACVVSGFTHPDDIDSFGPNGFDGVWLEGEHGAVDAAELGNLTRACDIWGMTSIVRINLNEQGLIYRTLDRGAPGHCCAARQHEGGSAEPRRWREIRTHWASGDVHQSSGLWGGQLF